jgi:chromate reductase
MAKVNVAVIVGSNRRKSINRKLAHALVELADSKLVGNFVRIDDLPIYNQDLESPLAANVQRFKSEIEQADALLFVTPEHNRSIPAVLKNAIDWGARPYGRNSWSGKLPRSPAPRLAPSAPPWPSSICARYSGTSELWSWAEKLI